MFEAIILAGGLGTRLRGVVSNVPKPLAPVAGRPFLAWQLDYLISSGVSRFILSVGFRADLIEAYFGKAYRDREIVYAIESAPLGTGGAMQRALSFARSERVFAFNGDSLCDVDLVVLRRLTQSRQGAIGMYIKHVDDAGRFGVIKFDEVTHEVLGFAEKSTPVPGWINAGVYDLPRDVLEHACIELPFSFEREILQTFPSSRLLAQPAGAFFIDIGVPDDYKRAQAEIPAWVAERER